ncbi:MAG: cyclopropane-fatty-acyl-phospholipid synthase family protein [Phycisphaerales bacterium]|nr:class I SAM-dependent methyltransferase [Phycisphaerales bacterium]
MSHHPHAVNDSIDSVIRQRASRTRVRRAGILETVGRRVARSAISRVATGKVRLVDHEANLTMESPGDPGGLPVPTIRVLDPAFYSAAAFGGSVGVGEAFIEGAWETDDLPGLIEVMTINLVATESLDGAIARLIAPLSRAAYWLERNTRAGSRRNIVAHYDLGNDFFRLFLDRTMTYSSAIFKNGAVTLEQAQIEKMDRACRKLALKPSDHLLEIGTGWGSMAIHAASKYGCRVTTTTISDEQHAYAQRRVSDAGLGDRVHVIKRDYRDLDGRFDKLVSIEMIEAVGSSNVGTYFDICSRCLASDGAALIQAIVIRDQFYQQAARRRDFLKKYIFPGSCLMGVRSMLSAIESRTDLRLWHMEDFGPDYATTLSHWRRAFLSQVEEVRAMGFDNNFIRMWEYYLAYCEGVFRARQTGVVQMLLVKPMCRLSDTGSSFIARTV